MMTSWILTTKPTYSESGQVASPISLILVILYKILIMTKNPIFFSLVQI